MWSMKMLKKGVKNNKKAYKNKNKYEPSGPKLIPESSNQEYFYSPLDGMLVHHRVTLGIKFAGTHSFIYLGRERHCAS